jgi:hypothetical protein
MSDQALESVETAMSFARARGALLAEDVANARTPGFVARDASLASDAAGAPVPFSVVMQDVAAHGSVSVLEYAMAAQARNAVSYQELADQERAMLHELRTVAEESRR